MTESRTLPKIADLWVDFLDREGRKGLRSNVKRFPVDLATASERDKARLLRDSEGKIIEYAEAPDERAPGTGVLMCKFADDYSGKELELGFFGRDSIEQARKKTMAGKPVKISQMARSRSNADLSEFTEYIVIKYRIDGEKKHRIEVHPLNRRIAKSSKDFYGDSVIEFKESKFWGKAVVNFERGDKKSEYDNFIGSNTFSSLVTKEGVKFDLADSMFEPAYAMDMDSGSGDAMEDVEEETLAGDRLNKIIEEVISVEKSDAEKRLLKAPNSETCEKLVSMYNNVNSEDKMTDD
jgi:hypothetical protein